MDDKPSEVERKRKTQAKAIADATALQVLEASDGWKIVKGWMDGAVAKASINIMDSTKTPPDNMAKIAHYQAVYQTYNTLFLLIENRKREGLKAIEDKNDWRERQKPT